MARVFIVWETDGLYPRIGLYPRHGSRIANRSRPASGLSASTTQMNPSLLSP